MVEYAEGSEGPDRADAAEAAEADAAKAADDEPAPDDRAEGSAPPPIWRFAPAPFAPGWYTNTLVRTTRATHARQHIREEMESSFALDLTPDGTATLCRAWLYLSTNRGPAVQTEERIREQLGYRGSWRRAGDEVRVELERDDSVCPRVGEYLELIPRHEDRWELVCHPVVALEGGDEGGGEPGGSSLPGPMLLCPSPFPSPRFGEDEPHLVGGVLLEGEGHDPAPHRWIVLAAGDGVQIRAKRTSVEATAREWVRMEG